MTPVDRDTIEALSGAGSFTHDLATGEAWLSPQLRRLLGLPRDPAPPARHTLCELVHADDAATLARLMVSLGPDAVGSADCRVRLQHDATRRLLVTCRRRSGEDVVVGVVHDVSETRRMEDRLRDADAGAPIGALTAGVVHDVNNLLAVATLHLARVRRLARDDGGLRHALDDVDGALLRAGTLARHLLGAARQEPPDAGIVHVPDVVRGVESLLRRVLPRRIDLVVRAPQVVPPVAIHALQLERVLINLVLNARDAIDEVGAITITVSEPPGDPPRIRVEVADTGRGMSDADRARVLAGPFSTKAATTHFGLGLAVVRSVVEQVGGTVTVDSGAGVGSRFSLTLPTWPVASGS